MIDTIVLTIPRSKYIILDHNRFEPSTKGLFEPPYYSLGARSNFSCKQNPTKKDFQSKIYKPRLTITKRLKDGSFDIPLKIELSLPKLIFGNNFDELEDKYFDDIILKLRSTLEEMGILINNMDLVNAQVSSVHYSKNIALTDYSTCSTVINELSKINLNLRMDLDKTSFRNEGQIIHYHCNSYEIAIYDKIKDLEQAKVSEKRSIEKGNIIQLNLLDDLDKLKPFEVLRIEVRLNTKNKIKQVLKSININAELTFKNLFSLDISKSVINYFWKEIEDNINIISAGLESPSRLLETIMSSNNISCSKALKLLSLIILAQEVGFRTLRSILNLHGKKNYYWYSLLKELKELNFQDNKRYRAITEIAKSIENFEPLSLKYYQNAY